MEEIKIGDRYEIDKKCIYCGELNEDIWYAPTSSSYTFDCEKCGKTNFIKPDFSVIKVEDVTLQDVKEGFEMTTMGGLTEKQVNDNCKEYYQDLIGRKKT